MHLLTLGTHCKNTARLQQLRLKICLKALILHHAGELFIINTPLTRVGVLAFMGHQ